MPITKCPVCGGTVEKKSVTEVVLGGGNAARLNLDALVCQVCSERYYTLNDTRKLEELKSKLERQEIDGLRPLGRTFEMV